MKTINEAITKVCTKRFGMEKTYSPMEFKRKFGKFYFTVNKFHTPITSLPLARSKTNIYLVDSEIQRLGKEIEQLSSQSRRKKLPKDKRKKINKQLKIKTIKYNNRINLRKLYTRIEKRLDKIAVKYGYKKKAEIDKHPIWIKAITNNTISILSLLV